MSEEIKGYCKDCRFTMDGGQWCFKIRYVVNPKHYCAFFKKDEEDDVTYKSK